MNKVVISMTSIERRIGTLGWTLDSIYAQSFLPTEVRLYGVPAVVDQEALEAYPQLRRIATEDRGPVTKLSAITDPDLDDDDLVVTVDDDIIYEPHWLKTLVAGAEEHPGAAVGFSGWNASSFVADPESGYYVFPADPGPRDVLEGWTGIAYRRSFFLDASGVMAPSDLFRCVDDVWISWQLRRKGTPRLTLPYRAPIVRGRPDALPGLCNRPDFVQLNRSAAVASFGSLTKIELGSGRSPTPGYIYHDRKKHSPHVDVAHDLDVLPWPWASDSCDEILGLDVFEHLQRMPEEWLRECHRILRPGGQLRLRVPIFGSPWHLIDPTHVRGYHPLNFDYFIRDRDLYAKYGHFYFDFAFSAGSVTTEEHNIVALLTK